MEFQIIADSANLCTKKLWPRETVSIFVKETISW